MWLPDYRVAIQGKVVAGIDDDLSALTFDPDRAFDPNGRGIAMAKAMSFMHARVSGQRQYRRGDGPDA